MKNTINFSDNPKSHRCVGEIEGDEIIFRCPACLDYERRINLKTGEMKNMTPETNTIPHHGFEMKPGFDTFQFNPN
jgi:hypothetical protein